MTPGIPLLQPERFAAQVDGKPVALYVLHNANGRVACITNYGAKILVFLA